MTLFLRPFGRPFFRCIRDDFQCPDGLAHAQIRGRFSIRRPDLVDRSRTRHFRPEWFQYDTGAELSTVSTEFATEFGFGDFRTLGEETRVGGFDDGQPPRRGWIVWRWVRFHNWDRQPTPTNPGAGRIEDFEFHIRFLVVEDATIHVPLLGLIDLHHYFDLSSRDGEFFFILATNDPNVVLLDADGKPGVRLITS